jgi:transposase InsO family protein
MSIFPVMPWKNTSLIGQRWQLVKTLLRGDRSVSAWCRTFGLSRKTAYKWLRRFTEGGRRDLQDHSRRPHRVPLRMRRKWIERIARARQRQRHWGARKIQTSLLRQYGQAPATATIARWLRRLQLTTPRRRRPRKARWLKPLALTVANAPNHVWTADFKGWFRTGNGQRVEPLTVRDLFSRYILEIRLLPDQRWQPVQAVFKRLFQQYGRPQVIRTDNGGPFASSGPAGLSRLSAWWQTLGIEVEFIRPGHPEENGAHEQMHRVFKTETTRSPTFTRQGQQHRTTGWISNYNWVRLHEALGQKVPASRYHKSPKRLAPPRRHGSYPTPWPRRQVRSNGEIKWCGRHRFIGEAFVGQCLGLKPLSAAVQAVYFGPLLIGHLHDDDPGAMRPAVYLRRQPITIKPKV